MAAAMMQEKVWFDKWRFDDAERMYQEKLAGTAGAQTGGAKASPTKTGGQQGSKHSELVDQIIQARQRIQNTLKSDGSAVSGDSAMLGRIEHLEKVTQDLQAMVTKLTSRISALESGKGAAPAKTAPAKPAPAKPAPADDDDDDDDDFELFGSGDEDEDAAAEKLKQERLEAYAAKKSKKPAVIAKSTVVLDIKPWDDETDMAELEKSVRSVAMDGLVWGASKLVPVGYGIKKLQIMCVIEDDKVSTEDLEDQIREFEDFVQSTDIVAFNKV